MKFSKVTFGAVVTMAVTSTLTAADQSFSYEDVFNLEYASGARVAPDGQSVAYERRSMDIMTDSMRTNIWSVDLDGQNHRPILSGKAQYRMPRFSSDGTRLAYVSSVEGKTQIYVKWLDTGQVARVTDVNFSPSSLSWSPDGKSIAFTMFVPKKATSLFTLPAKPKGAKWAGNAQVVDRVTYRADGRGMLPTGFTHIFSVPADGGTPRQLSVGDFNHGSNLSWLPDSSAVVFSANRGENWELDPAQTDVFKVDVNSGDITQLTNRIGPDQGPQVSPDGSLIAYTGFDDQELSSQNNKLYVMAVDGSSPRVLTDGLDRSVGNIQWSADGQGLYYSYDSEGKRLVGYVTLTGGSRVITNQLGGTTLGRPYTSGEYRAAPDGRIVFTQSNPQQPADLAVVDRIGRTTALTTLNADVFTGKKMATVEELQATSSVDGRSIQAWLVKPANYDSSKKYPLILEIHGGPHAAYGPHFSSEVQLYAAAGYMVLYVNPRGSTSYGQEFANLIHHNYPSQDYDDLMDAVNVVVGAGNVDDEQLYITGGSGGGTLTAWSIGKTNRFKAAVVAKPVINWASFVLTADFSNYFTKYWFASMPWEDPTHYWQRSPLSLVGNVETPTMLLTGENDYRTPMSETEQYYEALKLRGIDSVMVRIPKSGHGIASKPSNLVQKVGNILAWFEKYSPASGAEE